MSIIYKPSGKAGEYSKYACNFYNGCSNGCTYCYCKKGMLAKTLGGNNPILKKCFKNEEHALALFQKDLLKNLLELQKYGLFFNFTTDPMLPETIELTIRAIDVCVRNNVPVKILTKMAYFVNNYGESELTALFPLFIKEQYRNRIAFGFTLTGQDELEPGAATNEERILAMKRLHNNGFKTFASIEPIIDFDSSFRMIRETLGYCDLYKIGLMSGQLKTAGFVNKLNKFVFNVSVEIDFHNTKVYWKDSITKITGKIEGNVVDSDYNMFTN